MKQGFVSGASAYGPSCQLVRCSGLPGVGVQATCRLSARTSQFDPKPSSLSVIQSWTSAAHRV